MRHIILSGFLGFDELTDVMDTAQLFFIQGVNTDFEVTEESASVTRLQGTTINKNISKEDEKNTNSIQRK